MGSSTLSIGIYVVFMLALIGLLIAATVVLFIKAGEPWWKAIIPFYSFYVMIKIARVKKPLVMFFVLLVYYILVEVALRVFMTGMLENMAAVNAGDLLGLALKKYLLELLMLLPVLILSLMVCIKLAKAFGRSNGFGVGIFFLTFIFLPVLAFGKNEYQPLTRTVVDAEL